MISLRTTRDMPNGADVDWLALRSDGPSWVVVNYGPSPGPTFLWEQRVPVHGLRAPDWVRVEDLVDRMRRSNIRQGGSVAPDDGLDTADRLGHIDVDPPLQSGNIYRVWGTNDGSSVG